MANDTLSRTELVQVLHDLNGPIITAVGFQNELEQALLELMNVMKEFDADNDACSAAFKSVIEEDFAPCLEHLGAALSTLRCRANQLANVRPARPDSTQ